MTLHRDEPPRSMPSKAHGRAGIWLLFFIIVGAVAVWWYFAPGSLPDVVRAVVPPSPRSNPPLYKWRDAKGGWNVTDIPPTDRPYETLHYDPKVNVVPSVAPPPESH